MAQNPLYNVLQGNTQPNQLNGLIGRFKRFREQMQGDPKQQIQQMLNSGKISQQQYNQAVQMANQLAQLLKGF